MKSLYSLVILSAILVSCKKSSTGDNNGGTGPGTGTAQKLSYGDSIFYLKGSQYTITPNLTKPGTYTAFPENLLIDNATGAITVTTMGKGGESQTGLRYKIKFQAAGSAEVDSTFIVIGGITYQDKFYYLSQNDSIISPIYNADLSRGLPAGSYGIQADRDLAINPATGQINIKETIRRGFFDTPAENGEWEEVTIRYQSNDGSNSVMNRLDIALYYYNTVNDVPSNISSLVRARQPQLIGIPQAAIPVTHAPVDNDLPDNLAISRPRPPCIFIIGR